MPGFRNPCLASRRARIGISEGPGPLRRCLRARSDYQDPGEGREDKLHGFAELVGSFDDWNRIFQ